MNATLRAITLNELRGMVADLPDAEIIVEYANLADPLFAAEYGNTLLGFVAFVPQTLMSDSAYVWVHTLPTADHHQLVTARLARRWMATFHSRYPKLLGHCFTDRSRQWLSTLGATFGPRHTFTIEPRHV